MGLEKLKSIFQTGLDGNIKKFKQTTVTNVNRTNFFNEPPQPTIHIATNPTDFSTANGNNNLSYTPLTFNNNGTTFFNTPPRPTQFLATNPTDFSTAVGNNDSAFTPLSQLGQSALDSLSWEKLYNSDHTPLNNPQHKGLIAVNYGPNVNRDKLSIRDSLNSSTNSSIFSLSRTSLLFPNQGEPYIVSDIPSNDSTLGGGRLLNQGPIAGIPINRMLTDTARITKFLSSPKGIGFIARQNILGGNLGGKSVFLSKDGKLKSSKQRFKSRYNPLSTLLQTAGRAGFGPIGNVDKTEPGLSSLFGSDEYGSDSFIGGTVDYKINDTFTEGSSAGSLTNPLKKIGNKLLNAIKSNAGVPVTIKEKSDGGDKMTLAKIVRGDGTQLLDFEPVPNSVIGVVPMDSIFAVNVDVEAEKNGMPFYFKDMRDNKYIFFRAFIEGLSENISPGYNPTQYIGRSEPVYTYTNTEREISMTLKLFAQTKEELGKIYEKMNKLTSLCYPEYFEDEGVSYGNRMKAPLTKLRIGELFGNANSELQGYIKSLSYSVDQASPYETEVGKRVPKYVTATIGYQVIHSSVPNLETKFYGYIGD